MGILATHISDNGREFVLVVKMFPDMRAYMAANGKDARWTERNGDTWQGLKPGKYRRLSVMDEWKKGK